MQNGREKKNKLRSWRRKGYVPIQCVLTCGVLLCALLMAPWAIAEDSDAATADVSAWIRISPATTPYHLPVTLEIVVEGPQIYEYRIDALPEDLPGLEIVSQGQDIISLDTENYRQVDRFLLDPLEPGAYVLPALTIQWGEDGEHELPPVLFQARALTEAERERLATMAPVAEPDQLAIPQGYGWGSWALGVLLLSILGGIFLYFYRSRVVEAPTTPSLPPWEAALQRLNDLQARDLAASGHYDRYYVDLSAILRYYIEDRFYVHAPEQTTQEFLEAAGEKQVLDETFREDIAHFLRQSDRVKFARHIPAVEEMKENMELVRAYVSATIPKEAPGENSEPSDGEVVQ